MAKNWFITGGTPGGFGMAYADAALEIGDRVVLTARRPAELDEWAAAHGDRVLVLPLDVTDAAQVRDAVRTAEEHFGGIDVLVNNAGRGWYGSIEGMDDADVRAMFELNFFALLSVIRAALPGMRARGSGWIVNMSSVAGRTGVTGFGYYSATKFAVEAVTDVLRQEVAPLGIRVMAVEPGAFRTHAYAGFTDEPITESIAAYRPMLEQVRSAISGVQIDLRHDIALISDAILVTASSAALVRFRPAERPSASSTLGSNRVRIRRFWALPSNPPKASAISLSARSPLCP